ncbi:MAG: hypothetical protein JSR97_02840 [Verrucomicrobia bacterium]|nr:hypothetical protein [Verrucomicrobiota bacterium]
MNPLISSTILASTLFLFFILPGIIFQRAFWRTDKGSLHADNFYNYLVWGILISSISYYLGIYLFNACVSAFHYSNQIDLNKIIEFVFSKNENIHLDLSEFNSLVILFIILDVLLWLLGTAIGTLILKTKLDLRKSFFRYKNQWFYLLTQREIDFKNRKLSPKGHIVIVDLLSDIGGSSYLYNGVVLDYKTDANQNLKYIYLIGVSRTEIKASAANPTTVQNPKTEILNTAAFIKGSIDTTGSIFSNGSMITASDINADGGLTIEGMLFCGGSINIKGDLIIKNTQPFSQEVTSFSTSSPYKIPGSMMVFKFEEMKNLNIYYSRIP